MTNWNLETIRGFARERGAIRLPKTAAHRALSETVRSHVDAVVEAIRAGNEAPDLLMVALASEGNDERTQAAFMQRLQEILAASVDVDELATSLSAAEAPTFIS